MVLAKSARLSFSPRTMPLEMCTKLWEVEKMVIPIFNLHQFYVFQRDFFFYGRIGIGGVDHKRLVSGVVDFFGELCCGKFVH